MRSSLPAARPTADFEPAVRTPGWACRSPPAAQGSEASPAARNTLDSARIPRASKLLICGLFQKGRVLAQDGVRLHSAIGYIAPLDFMAGKAPEIWSERDRKLEQAREARRERRSNKVPA